MEELLKLLNCNSGTILIIVTVLGIFVEISPIEVNPISFIVKWVGDTFNRNTREQLSFISSKLDDVSDRIDKIEINDMRSTILDFANSCMNGKNHTKEEFEHVIDLHTQYEETIVQKGLKNGRVDLAFRYISDLYTKCLNGNSFLDS